MKPDSLGVDKLSMDIYFIRHGETYFNYLQKIQGWSDTPLTKKGHEDAYKMGRTLGNLGEIADTIYSSDMIRSIQTITELNNGYKAAGGKVFKIKTMPELREQFYGSFEGQLKKDVYSKVSGKTLEETLKELSVNEIQDKIAKLDPKHLAENSKDFWNRFAKGIEKILETETKPTIVVTNSAVLIGLVNTYAPFLLDQIEPDSLSLTKVHFESKKFEPKIVYYNERVEQDI